MEKVRVELGKNSYDIIIGQDILKELDTHIKDYDKVLLISNDKVGKIYSDQIKKVLQRSIKDVHYFEIKDGEEYKSIDTVLPIYDYMVENNFDRSSLVVSLGGGVVCDLTGYVAATFMRGVDFVQIPTSLLAQVDASIGGKVAVNHSKGKNLIGSFYQPKLVYIDIDTLKTLEMREIKTGLSEIIKHSVIWDKDYFQFLMDNTEGILNFDSSILIKTIKRSCEIKAEIVSQDETEKGIRKLLNYGHTYGHVIESLTKYKVYRHGEAVTAGMYFAALLAKKLNLVNDEFIKTQNALFEKFGMEYEIPKYDYEVFTEILKHDKKIKQGKLVFIVPEKIGLAKSIEVDDDTIADLYKSFEGKEVKGVIDIGTNTVRLFLGEVKNKKIEKKYKKYMEVTRLGKNVDKTRLLDENAMKTTIDVLKRYKNHAREHGVKDISAAATSAMRDAQNSDDFIKRTLLEAGVKINVISGIKEGEFAFAGVLTDTYDKSVLVLDIGGGSTEFVYGDKNGVEYAKSLDMGSVRIKEKFFSDGQYNKHSQEAKQWIFAKLEAIKEMQNKDFVMVGVAGTITSQVSVLKKMEQHNSEEIHKYKLTKKEIDANYELFKSKNIEELKLLKGLHPKRADVIAAGTFLLKTILEYFEIDSITVSEKDMLEGLLLH